MTDTTLQYGTVEPLARHELAIAVEHGEQVTIWSRWPDDSASGGYWVVERSYPARYVVDVYGGTAAWADSRKRQYGVFAHGVNPNGTQL